MTASAVLSRSQSHGGDLDRAVARLLVTWQHPHSRVYHPVGVLEATSQGYEFAYLRRALDVVGFRSFLGFSNLHRRYRSPQLFALFRERLMNPARPDAHFWRAALAVDDSATDMQLLARSGGSRPGDTIELLPEPSVAAGGETECVFLVHGVRHLQNATERIAQLVEGEQLLLVDEPTNVHNPRAVLVTASDRMPLGWIPDPLLDYVHDVKGGELSVVRANGPEIGPQLRLLARLSGHVRPGYRAFTGPGWETVA